eukprot:TRINITY_DN11569_c0_g1_i1.p1 TRINITY_DN11569_c0_g1~~TRINITY_DN11569_c0_g1_i1.p1  ORF type:complete len:404 (-),score=75.20 TRINITY_DN11569_c0_g1_i1:79-1290(-)
MVLAPSRPMVIRILFCPVFNLAAVSECDLEQMETLNFNVLSFFSRIPDEFSREHYLWLLIMRMFIKFDLVEYFKISETRLYRFIGTICRRYRDVPFHNWYHAFNVTQTMYFFLVRCECHKLFSKLEIFSMLLSTLCHDADHPGLNNIFYAKASSRIANLHKKSTLENHHLLHAMSVLSLPECGILGGLSPQQLDQLHLNLRDMILATDLSLHKLVVASVEQNKKQLHKAFKKPLVAAILNREQKIPAMCCLIKCSDLSNEIRPADIAILWATRVNAEFFNQSAKEKELNLPVTPWMDPNKIIIEKEQINFITTLCMPLYKTLHSVFPTITPCLDQLKLNLMDWIARLQEKTTREQVEKLSGRSVWEDEQETGKEGKNLSSNLGIRSNPSVKYVRSDVRSNTAC